MSSLSNRAKIFKFFWANVIRKNFSDVNTLLEKTEKTTKHKPIKGYVLEVKETEAKTKYLRMKKDNNVEATKVIYYLHGGIYLLGLNNMYKAFSCVLCDLRDDIEVILLDYSLAPDNTYPTQLNEALDLWKEITKTFDPKNIIIGGDSAGGNLSLALIQKLKKDYDTAPGACFMFSPWADMTCTSESFRKNFTTDLIVGTPTKLPVTDKMIEDVKNSVSYSFIGNADREDPYISPIFADYSTFPKSIFFVGDEEMLLDDTLTIVKKIRENPDNQVELIVKEGMFHIYPLLGSFSSYSTRHNFYHLPEGKEAIERVKKFILDYYQ